MRLRLALLSALFSLSCAKVGSPCGPRLFGLVNLSCPSGYSCVDRDLTGCVFNCGPFCVAACNKDAECPGGCVCGRFGEALNTCVAGPNLTTTDPWQKCGQ